MNKIRLKDKGNPETLTAFTAFLVSFCFFLLAYPYHLIRREEQTLFVYDWDYIRQTYRGNGWLARFFSDFLEQFFHLPGVGPFVIALLLLGICVVVYRICRHFLGKWPSLAIAALFFLWSFTDKLISQFFIINIKEILHQY